MNNGNMTSYSGAVSPEAARRAAMFEVFSFMNAGRIYGSGASVDYESARLVRALNEAGLPTEDISRMSDLARETENRVRNGGKPHMGSFGEYYTGALNAADVLFANQRQMIGVLNLIQSAHDRVSQEMRAIAELRRQREASAFLC
jgi:hypothetical protein